MVGVASEKRAGITIAPAAVARGVRGRVSDVPLGAWAIVMATGIVAIAVAAPIPRAGAPLRWLAVAALAALVGLTGLRLAVHRDHMLNELSRPETAFDGLELVAGIGVLGTIAYLRGDRFAGAVLAAAAAAGWVLVLTRIVVMLIASRRRLSGRATGGWLLVVVSTQSVAGAAALSAREYRIDALAVAGAIVWVAGLAAYGALIFPVAGGLRRLVSLRRFTADHWIAMGALAISALAASALVEAPGTPLRGAIRDAGLAIWVLACAWILPLVAADLRCEIHHHAHLPGASQWSMVFPVGMLAASAQELGRVAGHGDLVRIGDWLAWPALAAWLVVAAGVGWSAVRAARRLRAEGPVSALGPGPDSLAGTRRDSSLPPRP